MKNSTDLFQPGPNGAIRLGLGEVVDADQIIPTWLAREAFTLALKMEAPGVMPGLLSEALSPFLELLTLVNPVSEEMRERGVGAPNPQQIDRMAALIDQSGTGKAYVEAIEQWARGWNLRAGWIRAVAWDWLSGMLEGIDIESLESGLEAASSDLPGADGEDKRIPVAYRPPHGISPGFTEHVLSPFLMAPGPRLLVGGKDVEDPYSWPLDVFSEDDDLLFDWNPATETRADNESRAVEWFRKRYRAAQEARVEEAQHRFPHPSKARSFEHFCWLVQYQVLRTPYAKIAKEAYRSRQTIAEAVQDTAHLIKLELREPDRPGRKRKSRAN